MPRDSEGTQRMARRRSAPGQLSLLDDYTRCWRCQRPLTDAVSAAAGLGPRCRELHAKEELRKKRRRRRKGSAA